MSDSAGQITVLNTPCAVTGVADFIVTAQDFARKEVPIVRAV